MLALPKISPKTRSIIKTTLLIWFVSRVVCIIFAYLGTFHFLTRFHWAQSSVPHLYFYSPIRLLDIFVRWDAGHYLSIAENGYGLAADKAKSAFFPLFPLLIRIFFKFHLEPVISTFVLNSILLIVSVIVFLHLNPNLPHKLLAFVLIISPASFFYSMVYSEALILFLIVMTFYLANKNSFFAFVPAMFATATRPPGVALSIFLLAFGILKREKKFILASFFSLFGIFSYMIFMKYLTGDALHFYHVQQEFWHRQSSVFGVFKALFQFKYEIDHYFLAILSLVLIGLRIYHRRSLAHTLFSFIMVMMPLSTGTLMSYTRFFLPIVPLHEELVQKTTPRWIVFSYCLISIIYLCLSSYRLGQGWPYY